MLQKYKQCQLMQIKSETYIDKRVLDALFHDLSHNHVLVSNAFNIKFFFEIFQNIKNHRTLEKICQAYTKNQRQMIFQHYCEIIDKLEEHMEKFQHYTMEAVVKRKKIKILKTKYLFDEWKQAIDFVSYQGQKLTETIETKLKLIIKVFSLESRLPVINWKRWRQLCTDAILVKGGFCGCFS